MSSPLSSTTQTIPLIDSDSSSTTTTFTSDTDSSSRGQDAHHLSSSPSPILGILRSLETSKDIDYCILCFRPFDNGRISTKSHSWQKSVLSIFAKRYYHFSQQSHVSTSEMVMTNASICQKDRKADAREVVNCEVGILQEYEKLFIAFMKGFHECIVGGSSPSFTFPLTHIPPPNSESQLSISNSYQGQQPLSEDEATSLANWIKNRTPCEKLLGGIAFVLYCEVLNHSPNWYNPPEPPYYTPDTFPWKTLLDESRKMMFTESSDLKFYAFRVKEDVTLRDFHKIICRTGPFRILIPNTDASVQQYHYGVFLFCCHGLVIYCTADDVDNTVPCLVNNMVRLPSNGSSFTITPKPLAELNKDIQHEMRSMDTAMGECVELRNFLPMNVALNAQQQLVYIDPKTNQRMVIPVKGEYQTTYGSLKLYCIDADKVSDKNRWFVYFKMSENPAVYVSLYFEDKWQFCNPHQINTRLRLKDKIVTVADFPDLLTEEFRQELLRKMEE